MLYAVEESVRGKPPELRRAERQARAGPVLVALRAWLDVTLKQLSQKSALAEAIRYALARWDALVRYSTNGNRSLSGVLCPPAPTRNNPSHIHEGGAGSDQGDSDQQQVAAA